MSGWARLLPLGLFTAGRAHVRNEREDMQIKATFQIQGKPDLEKVIEGTDNQEIWNSIIAELSALFPECDKEEIEMEKQMPNPIFVARNGQGEELCQVVCEQA